MTVPRRPDADAPNGGVRVHASLPTPPERRGRLATLLSFLLHALFIFFAIRLTATVVIPKQSPIGDAIRIALGGGGGGGQGAKEISVSKPPPPPPPQTPVVTPPPVAPPIVTPPPVETPPPAATRDTSSAPSTGASAGRGTGTGGGEGSGEGPGKGSGKGPGEGDGTGGGRGTGRGGRGPETKQMILPAMDAPKSLRGKTVTIAFDIGADGAVTDIAVTPPIPDKGYAKRFDETMRGYRFRPATDSVGKPIASKYTIEITLGN